MVDKRTKSLALILLTLSQYVLVPISAASEHQISKRQAGNANQYLDEVLENLQTEIKSSGNDPLTLKDEGSSFSKKILFVRVSGGASFKNGKLYGLSTIKRTGTSTISTHGENLVIEATLGIPLISASYDYRAWFKPININGKARGSVKDVNAEIKLTVPTSGKPQLTKFDLKLGKINLDISGLGPLTWVLSKLTTLLSNALRTIITDKIEGPIKKSLQNLLNKSKFTL